jgi:hypothetical protein
MVDDVSRLAEEEKSNPLQNIPTKKKLVNGAINSESRKFHFKLPSDWT